MIWIIRLLANIQTFDEEWNLGYISIREVLEDIHKNCSVQGTFDRIVTGANCSAHDLDSILVLLKPGTGKLVTPMSNGDLDLYTRLEDKRGGKIDYTREFICHVRFSHLTVNYVPIHRPHFTFPFKLACYSALDKILLEFKAQVNALSSSNSEVWHRRYGSSSERIRFRSLARDPKLYLQISVLDSYDKWDENCEHF